MIRKIFITTNKLFLRLILCCVLFLIVAGCVSWRKALHLPKSTSRTQSKPAEAKTQQYYYNQGLQLYSKENYKEAREAFEQVVELGPNTVLGLKAQENIKKIKQILKTVEEIESK